MRALSSCLLLALSAPFFAQEFERLRFQVPDRASSFDTPVDFDGDGDPDLLGGRGALSACESEVLLFRNERGKLVQELLYSFDPASGPAIGCIWDDELPFDANADGRLDVLLLALRNADRFLIQQPNGSFLEVPPPTSLDFNAVDAADVDSDGDVDLLYSGGRPWPAVFQPDLLLQNDGTGSFSDASALFPDVVESHARFFDFDADDDHDILRVTALGADDLLENDGAGGLRSLPIQTLGVNSMSALGEVRDLDRDGDLDVFGKPGILNAGEGKFVPFETSDPSLRTFFPMDWSGDGGLDFVANAPMGPICGCRLPGLFAFTFDRLAVSDPLLEAQPGVDWLLSRDWDGDGDDDLLFHGDLFQTGPHYPTLLFSRGNEGFESRAVAPDLLTTSSVQLADADGDGDVDAFTGGLSWLENDGLSGGWTEHVVVPFVRADRYVLLDWDLDGDRDAAARLRSSSQVWSMGLYQNDGTGSYSDVSGGLPTAVTNPDSDLAAGDLDGDGLPDLLVLTQGPEFLFLGNGDGTFEDVSAAASLPNKLRVGDLGDLDRDGDLDAALYSLAAAGSLSLVERFDNPGDGLLVATGEMLDKGQVSDLELADFDADGVLDLVVYQNPDLDIHRGDGAGFFERPRAFRLTPAGARPGSIVDLDRDGWPDLLAAGPTYLRNAGDFAFEDRSAQIKQHRSAQPPAVADLDLDGDLDLWSPHDLFGTRILWNLERQLAWHHWPLVGEALVLDVRGTPQSSFGLWASSSPPLAHTPGAFRLDPVASSLLRIDTLDASGRSLPRIELPAELSLVGEELYWQALIGAPYHWSNVERTVLGHP